LYIDLKRSQILNVGSLRIVRLPAGRYVYIGSARRGIAARVSRHKRLAIEKSGKLHWHIDYLLVNPHTKWAGVVVLEDGIECKMSKQIAAMSGVTAPVPGFGSTDCRSKCRAHLYLLPIEATSALRCAAYFFRYPSMGKACAGSPQFEGTLQQSCRYLHPYCIGSS